jgi:hypothetical protein
MQCLNIELGLQFLSTGSRFLSLFRYQTQFTDRGRVTVHPKRSGII